MDVPDLASRINERRNLRLQGTCEIEITEEHGHGRNLRRGAFLYGGEVPVRVSEKRHVHRSSPFFPRLVIMAKS
ncbi:hypothetical protein D3C71_2136760 [compost metagenome]